MTTKFKKGDLVRIRTSGDIVMVLEYRVESAGSIYNYLLRHKVVDDEIITDEIFCEGTIDKKHQRKFINEANLILVTKANA